MTVPPIAIYLQDLGPEAREALWLAAAARVARQMPLTMSPFITDGDRGDDAFYGAIDGVARELAGPAMREAEEQLDRWLAILRTARPADLPAPCDSANALYTPMIDAAYCIGLAVGVRLGRALEGGDGAA